MTLIVGTNNSEVLNGTGQGDVIYGLGGNNTINGVGGNNILIGNDIFQSSIALVPYTNPAATGGGGAPVFSADGTKLAFWATDINTGSFAIYVANLITGTLTQEGGPGFQNNPTQLAWSPDGTELAITTTSSQTLNGNIFVLNLASGKYTLVSASAAGVPAAYNGAASLTDSENPVFSPNGTEVLFNSNANNLVAGSTAFGEQEVYLKNLITGAVTEVSVGSLANQGTSAIYRGGVNPQGSTNAVFSPDGNEVAFQSDDNTLTSDTPTSNNAGGEEIYVKNLLNNNLNLESQYLHNATDTVGNNASIDPEFSGDGNQVVFSTNATNFPQANPNAHYQVYIKSLTTQSVALESDFVDGSGNVTLGNGDSFTPSFTSNGHFIVFTSYATNLDPSHTYSNGDEPQALIKSPSTGEIAPLTENVAGVLGNSGVFSNQPTFGLDQGAVESPVGDMVAFVDLSSNLVSGATNPATISDIYVTTPGLSPLNFTGLSESGNDTLTGGPGNDTLVPGPATNTLNGGGGWNMVAYHLASNQVTITHNANGSTTITHPGGSDTVTNVELALFSDCLLYTSDAADE